MPCRIHHGSGCPEGGRIVPAIVATAFVGVLVLAAFSAHPALSQRSASGKSSDPTEILHRLEEDVAQGRIARLELRFVPYEVLTPEPVDPLVLDAQAPARLDVELTPDLAEGFARALEQTTVKPADGGSDLRFGVRLYDGAGRRLHTLYFDGVYAIWTTRHGYVDDHEMMIFGGLVAWLQQNFLDRLYDAAASRLPDAR